MLEIEIVECNIIEGGVEVFARAWQDGVQIGFGDGTVDIERFRVINPPHLIYTDTGTITYETTNEVTGEVTTYKLAENPEEAILQSLEHTISVLKKHDGSRIIPNKRGNTTTTVYGEDGALRDELNATWTAARESATAATSVENDVNSTAGAYIEYVPAAPSSKYRLKRVFLNFDTSSISDTDTIDSATMSLYVESTWDDANDAYSYISVTHNNSASDATFVAADFDDLYNSDGTTPIASGKALMEMCDSGEHMDLTSWSSSYADFSFNSTGLSKIDKTGYSKFGVSIGRDIEDAAPAHAGYTLEGISSYRGKGYTGTASDPKLVVVHSAATAGFTPKAMWFM